MFLSRNHRALLCDALVHEDVSLVGRFRSRPRFLVFEFPPLSWDPFEDVSSCFGNGISYLPSQDSVVCECPEVACLVISGRDSVFYTLLVSEAWSEAQRR